MTEWSRLNGLEMQPQRDCQRDMDCQSMSGGNPEAEEGGDGERQGAAG